MEIINQRWKYWILTINFSQWKPPASLESLSNVKYMRGQLLLSKSRDIHWLIAVQYFIPVSFALVKSQFAKDAQIRVNRNSRKLGSNMERKDILFRNSF
jgi:hypothetical protein